jgi:uncharacterized membrane protein
MKLTYTKLQIALEILAALALIATFVTVAVLWNSAPERLPTHFGASGAPDAWGGRGGVLALVIIAALLYALFTVITALPRIWNVPQSAARRDPARAYRAARTMLLLLKLELIATFGYMTYCMLRARPLSAWFLPAELIVLFGTVAIALVFILRSPKKEIPK